MWVSYGERCTSVWIFSCMIEWHCVPNMPNIIRKSFSNEIHVNGNAVLTAHTSCSYTMHTCPKAQLIFNSNQLRKKNLRKRKKNANIWEEKKTNSSTNHGINSIVQWNSNRSVQIIRMILKNAVFPHIKGAAKKKEKTRKRSKLKIHDGLNQGFK